MQQHGVTKLLRKSSNKYVGTQIKDVTTKSKLNKDYSIIIYSLLYSSLYL